MGDFRLTDDNYYSKDADIRYMSVSQYKTFAGTYGRPGCEYYAMEKLMGRWNEEPSDAMLIGSYVDSWVEGPESFEKFQREHPQMYKQDGTLYGKYRIGNTVISRISRDSYFMATLSGDKQTIMTGSLFGTDWKIKMDSYIRHEAIVDLKTVKSLRERKWVRDIGLMDFIDYWGYDVQGAIYQEIVRQNTGEKLPFFIAGVSKERYPDIEVILIPQSKLDEALYKVQMHMPRILAVKAGDKPDRCEKCDCCRDSKTLTGFIRQDEIPEDL